MTQEDKELLLKDLSARLPYIVKFLRESWNYEWDQELPIIEVLEDIDKDGYINNTKVYNVEDIKPYLFPLSNMTEKQKEEYHNLCSVGIDECGDIIYFNTYESIDYLNKNKFDYRYLIPMGLANDATGLNIY